MPFYHKLGKIPPKRHTQFRQDNGELYHEQLFGTIGFVGMSSLLYHRQRPTQVMAVHGSEDVRPVAAVERNLLSRKLDGWAVKAGKDWLGSRMPTLFNNDCTVALAAPPKVDRDDIYKTPTKTRWSLCTEDRGCWKRCLARLPFNRATTS